MVCRVRIRLCRGSKYVETIALVNSGFEAEDADIVVPLHVAEELDLWPSTTIETIVLDTAGGNVHVPYFKRCAILELILPDREPKRVNVNIMVDPHVDEVLISNYVASELGIMLLDLKKGLWKLKDNPPDKVRESEQIL